MDEYKLPIAGDLSQLIKDLGTTKSSLSDVNNAASDTAKNIKQSFDNASKSIENTNKVIQQTAASQNTLKRSQAELTDAIKFYQDKAFTEKDRAKVTAYNKQVQNLTDELDKAKNAGTKGFDELGNAVGKSTNAFSKAFSGLRLIANILPGIGIAGVLAFAAGPIIEYISQLDIFKSKAIDVIKIAAATSSEFAKSISDINALKTSISEFQSGIISKEELVSRYNESIGKTVGLLKTATEVEQFYNSKASAFVEAMFLRAQASAALEKATNDATKAVERAVNGPSFGDKLAGFFANVPEILGNTIEDIRSTISNPFDGRTNIQGFVNSVNRITEYASKAQAQAVKKIKDDAKTAFQLFDDLKKQADKFANENGLNFRKPDTKAENEAKRRREQVAAERLKLENQITQAQAKESDDRFELEKKAEDARYQVALNTLKKELKDFPELEALINKAIEVEKTAHGFRIAAIEIKQQKEREKIQSDGAKAIASVLKQDNQAQIDAVNQKYDDIIAKAKAANLYTTDVEKKLAEQRAKDVNEVNIKSINESNNKLLTIAISNIKTRQQKTGETDKEFELENQKAILAIKIEYAEKALQLIVNDPAKAAEVATIRENIAELKKQLKSATIELENENSFSFSKILQKSLKLDDSDFDKLKQGAAAIVNLFNTVADSISESYQREIDAGEKRIDALKKQLDEANSYFDKQNELKEKGYANDAESAQKNVDAIKASLAQEEAARQENIKNQQEAQKVAAAIRAVEIAANTTEQVVNLATAASKIFKAHAGIPFAGVVIALGAVAAMVAGFIAIKASIKAASTTTDKYKGGGKLRSKSHDNGGAKYRSDDPEANIIELEGDEFIVNANSTRKHEDMIDAINRDDFSKLKMNDYTLEQMLKATGVSTHKDVARKIGKETVTRQNAIDNKKEIKDNASENYLKRIEKNTSKLVKFEEEKETVTDFPDRTVYKKGNVTRTVWKK